MVVTLGKFSSLILYLTVYTLSALFLYIASCSSRKKNKFIIGAIAILLPCILAGFRYGVGVDFLNYKHLYETYSGMTFAEYLNYEHITEISAYFFSKIAALFNFPQLFFILYAFFIYAPVAKIIMEREGKGETFFLALFFLLGSFSTGLNIMRQVAAASILLYSLKYITDRNLKKFVFAVVIAAVFHVSAIIILPLYFIWNKRDKFSIFQFKSWLIIAAYFVFALNLPLLLRLLGDRFDGYGTIQTQGRNLSILLNCIWMVIFLLFNKRITKHRAHDGLYVFMIIIGTILSFTGMFNVYLKRTAIYFNYPDFILLTQLKYVFDLKSRGAFYVLATVYSLFMFILTYYILGQTGIFPYQYLS